MPYGYTLDALYLRQKRRLQLLGDSKLKKTSELFEVDYLPKKDIVYWWKMDFIRKILQ